MKHSETERRNIIIKSSRAQRRVEEECGCVKSRSAAELLKLINAVEFRRILQKDLKFSSKEERSDVILLLLLRTGPSGSGLACQSPDLNPKVYIWTHKRTGRHFSMLFHAKFLYLRYLCNSCPVICD